MHPNPAFRTTPSDRNIQFARSRSFGILAVNSDQAPLLSHVPFQLSADGAYLEAHLVRSNPILRLLEKPLEAVIAVSGGDAYVSPDWYGVDNQVPTWNYIAVHVRGTLERLEDQALRGILDRLSADMENRLAPKLPWTIGKMDDEAYTRMGRQIVPVGLTVSDIQGTWKLSQNKPADVRTSAISGLEGGTAGAEVEDIIKLMGLVRDD